MSVGMETREFKSPLRKLVRFFRSSRDAWKEKYRLMKRQCRKLANQAAAVEKSRDRWRQEAKELHRSVKKLEKELERQKLSLMIPVQSEKHRSRTDCGTNTPLATATAMV